MQTLGSGEAKRTKVLWIKNTLSCEMVMASEAYLRESHARPDLEPQTEPAGLKFDDRGIWRRCSSLEISHAD